METQVGFAICKNFLIKLTNFFLVADTREVTRGWQLGEVSKALVSFKYPKRISKDTYENRVIRSLDFASEDAIFTEYGYLGCGKWHRINWVQTSLHNTDPNWLRLTKNHFYHLLAGLVATRYLIPLLPGPNECNLYRATAAEELGRGAEIAASQECHQTQTHLGVPLCHIAIWWLKKALLSGPSPNLILNPPVQTNPNKFPQDGEGVEDARTRADTIIT